MNPLFDRIIRAQERRFGVPMGYLRQIAEAAPRAFVKFGLFAPIADHRRVLAPEPWHLARVAATQAVDCGPCLQTTINAARRDGLAPELIQAALDDDTARLPADAALAAAFGRAVALNSPDLAQQTAAVAARFGQAGRVEMALGVATILTFPLLKRGLGLAASCALDPPDVQAPLPR